MKAKAICFVVLFLSGLALNSQIVIEKDSILKKIKSVLPAGWIIKTEKTKLLIVKNDSVFTAYDTPEINGCGNCGNVGEEDESKIPSYAAKTKVFFGYELIPKWSNAKLKSEARKNDSVRQEIEKLNFQYKSGGTTFTNPKSGHGKMIPGDPAVDKFNNELSDKINKLRKQQSEIPYYCTEKYHVKKTFQYYNEGNYRKIYPLSVRTEFETLLEKISAYLLLSK